MIESASDWIKRAYPDRLRRIREPFVRQVLSLCAAEIDCIVKNPEQTDFGNESFLRQPDEFHDLVFAHNGAEDQSWEGLRCNRTFLTPEEYKFIVRCKRQYQFHSVVESGAGETSILFRRLGCSVLCIEWKEGPWVERAIQGGAEVKVVSFDSETAEFDKTRLAMALGGQPCDLIFVDSPVGTCSRSKILESFCRYLEPRFVLVHDAHRDVQNVYRWMRTFDLKVLEYLPSWRGSLLMRRDT